MFEQFLNFYIKNMVTVESLQKLLEAGKLTQQEFDEIVNSKP